MIDTNRKQFEIEENYIDNKYFSDFRIITLLESKNKHVGKAEVILNNMPYTLYKYKTGNVILVPTVENLFGGDFDEIYNLAYGYQGIHFNITKKKNGIIEMFNYDYHLEDPDLKGDSTFVMANYYNIDDSRNILYDVFKSKNLPVETFLIRSEISKIELEKNYKFLEIRKDNNGTLKKYTAANLETMVSDAINDNMDYEDLDVSSDESLIKIAEDILLKKELEGFKIKVKI